MTDKPEQDDADAMMRAAVEAGYVRWNEYIRAMEKSRELSGNPLHPATELNFYGVKK